MVFLIDDVLGMITTKPFMFIIDLIRQHALREMYPLDVIKSLLKENRLEYELGEISQEEYEQNNELLQKKLMVAQQVHDQHLDRKVSVL